MADSHATTDIAALVARHYPDVYRYAFRLSGTPEDAEELTQQVFLVAQTKLAQLRQVELARSWLFTILKRLFIKGRRHRQPIAAGSLDLKLENIPDSIPKADDIDRERLQWALDRLPPKHRLVLVMFYLEEVSYRDIAERLGVPLGTVMSRLARAKARLRDELFSSVGRENAEEVMPSPALFPGKAEQRTTVVK